MSMTMNFGLQRQGASAAWSDAARDAIRGVTIVARKLVTVSGLLLLSAFLALLVSEHARDRAVSWVLAGIGVEAQPGPDEAPPATWQARPGRWSDWLAASPAAGRLDPQQENVTRYLAQRYRVADGAVRQIVGAAFGTGRSIGVDPMLILAVTAIESSLNPFAQSAVGAQGLMQVLTRVHSEKFVSHGGDHAALDPLVNLTVGSEILKDLIMRGGSVERGLQLYVGAGNLPDDGGYSERVLGELDRIKMAAGGDVRAALAAGWRADGRARSKPATPQMMPVGAVDRASAPGAQDRPASST